MYVYTGGQNAGQTYKHGCRPDAVPLARSTKEGLVHVNDSFTSQGNNPSFHSLTAPSRSVEAALAWLLPGSCLVGSSYKYADHGHVWGRVQ